MNCADSRIKCNKIQEIVAGNSSLWRPGNKCYPLRLRHRACVLWQTLDRLTGHVQWHENMEQFFFKKGSSFTHNGDYFALVSVDGRLRIWDTTSGKLVQEFSPSTVTEASCTCLCWMKKERKNETSRKVKMFCIINLSAWRDLTSNNLLFSFSTWSGEILNQENLVASFQVAIWKLALGQPHLQTSQSFRKKC